MRYRRRWRYKRGLRGRWRWFDLAYLIALVPATLELERYYPRRAALICAAAAAGYLLLRVGIGVLRRLRLVRIGDGCLVSAVDPLRPVAHDRQIVAGKVRRLPESVARHLDPEGRCIACSLTLEEVGSGRVRLRHGRSSLFVVEAKTGPVAVDGVIALHGPSVVADSNCQAAKRFALERLDDAWCVQARLCEVVLDNRDSVEIVGGKSSRRSIEAWSKRSANADPIELRQGSIDDPVQVTIVSKAPFSSR
ncbi:MAG: hypothetical protein H6707_02760 [Deltaproteobacteria bacterium]|nr:hypothetical protein [Deltaproteobacteria bacterium]